MQSDDKPSIWDIRNCLLSSLDFAESFARDQPELIAAVAIFSQEICEDQKEFMNSFNGSSASSSLPDIVNGLRARGAMASIMA